MARLQDFQTVTPTNSDNILIVQSGGQGLATVGSTLGAKMDKANPTGTGKLSLNRASGSAEGQYSVSEGYQNTASGNYSHAEGYQTTASAGGAHSEGSGTTAGASQSHAEGQDTIASGAQSHAEGLRSSATGSRAHAEGQDTVASGSVSHAEGLNTKAEGNRSHSEGEGTIAHHKSQHVFGEYNIQDPSSAQTDAKGTYIEIVGKGTNDANRSNARTLDWSGNEVLAGGLKLHNTQDAATFNFTSVAASGTLDFTSYADGTIIFVYRPAKFGIYVKAESWTTLLPILPLSTITVNRYSLTNGEASKLDVTVISK